MNNKYILSTDFKLPSNGLIYNNAIDPNGRLKSMTTRDDINRKSGTKTQFLLLSEIIEKCIINKPENLSVYNLCIKDYEYLLHRVRIATHGPEYPLGGKCPFCGKPLSLTMSLEDLECVELTEENSKLFNELLELELSNGIKIKLRYTTPRMLDEIDIKTQEYNENHPDEGDNGPIFKLMAHIETYDNQKGTQIDLFNILDNMPLSDFNLIDQRIDDIDNFFGLRNVIKTQCPNPKCKKEVLSFFRIGPEFFRPTIR